MSFFVYHFCLIGTALQSLIELQNIVAHLTFEIFANNVCSYLRLCQVGIFELLQANNFKITLEGLQISQITKFQKQFMTWSEFLSSMNR